MSHVLTPSVPPNKPRKPAWPVERPAAGDAGSAADAVRLAKVFRHDCIQCLPAGVDKPVVLSLLVEWLVKTEQLDSERHEAIVAGLMERERLGSTAIGKGFAFPHIRTHTVSTSVGAVGLAADGVTFGGLDGRPTKLVALVLSPTERRAEHMAIMGRVVSLMHDTKLKYLIARPVSPLVFYEYLRDFDARF